MPKKKDAKVEAKADVVKKLEKAVIKNRKRKVVKPINRNRTMLKKARKTLQDALLPLFDKAKNAAKKLNLGIKKADEETTARIQAILSQLDLDGWGVFEDVSAEVLAAVTKDGVYQALLQIGMNGENMTEGMSSDALEYAESRAAALVTEISEATRDMLRSDVSHAIDEGWSTGKFADAIEENYAFSPERAETIARTETAFADSAGNMAAYRESGVVEGKEWVLGSEHPDDDECDVNAEAGVIPLDDDFPSGDDSAPSHPNCECDVMPVVYEENQEG